MTQDSEVAECYVELVRNHELAVPLFMPYGGGNSGFDLSSVEELTIGPGRRAIVDTGWLIGIADGWEGQVRPRSGNASKKGLTVLNTPGTVDASYRGPLKVILYNTDTFPITIRPGDKIAQIVFARVPTVQVNYVGSFSSSTERGEQGFGSSSLVGTTK